MEQRFQVGVKALLKDKAGNILIVKEHGKLRWDIPGGRIEENESIAETLKRETREELGVKNIEIHSIFDVAISKMKAIPLLLLVYHCKFLGKVALMRDSKRGEYRWIPKKDLGKFLSWKYPAEFIGRLEKDSDSA